MEKQIFYIRDIQSKSETKSDGSLKYKVKGYIDSSDLDKVNDIVTKSCMEDISNQMSKSTIKLDYDHETLRAREGESEESAKYNMTTMPLGKAASQELKGKGNFVEFDLNDNWKKFDSKGNVTMTFEDVWDSIQKGFYDAFSIAYIPVKSRVANVKGEEVRLLDKVNLLSVALTGNPINPNANITMSTAMAKSLYKLQNEREETTEVDASEGDIMTEQKPKQEDKSKADEKSYDKRFEALEQELKSLKESVEQISKQQEDKSNSKSEDETDKEKEDDSEVKSELKTLKEELSSVKSTLEKASQKARGPEDKSQKSEDDEKLDSNILGNM